MLSADDLTKHGQSIYAIVVAASKRARMINDWRIQREKVLMEDVIGPKVTKQALEEIASGEVRVVKPKAKEKSSS
jgi:DNA-directed RNA polymerase omega subunit